MSEKSKKIDKKVEQKAPNAKSSELSEQDLDNVAGGGGGPILAAPLQAPVGGRSVVQAPVAPPVAKAPPKKG